MALSSDADTASSSPDAVLVRDRGRGAAGLALLWSNGEVGDEANGDAKRVEAVVEELDMV